MTNYTDQGPTTGAVLGEFLFTTLTVSARIIIFMALLIAPMLAGTFLFPAEGALPHTVCKALTGSVIYGLLYGVLVWLAGKLASAVSGGRFGGISIDLAFVACAAIGFAYTMVTG